MHSSTETLFVACVQSLNEKVGAGGARIRFACSKQAISTSTIKCNRHGFKPHTAGRPQYQCGTDGKLGMGQGSSYLTPQKPVANEVLFKLTDIEGTIPLDLNGFFIRFLHQVGCPYFIAMALIRHNQRKGIITFLMDKECYTAYQSTRV